MSIDRGPNATSDPNNGISQRGIGLLVNEVGILPPIDIYD
ncbi:hypothetical protein PROVRUST_07711 [Providencia rustigianii DSM 4541]|uniref:Uncharacterized protein n=1 Tax=Providencia rustigianii DSM 4541 TaxID=500637 RepID=D1P646_9GAMM|nr:hypothetical protein PROVRUST_07711 [Providencia rustigianii DSM 4541]